MTTSIYRQTLPALVAGLLLGSAAVATAEQVTITIENLAPANGTYLTPVWVGFHNGTFDLYDSGTAASSELERLAEDGNSTPLSGAFTGAVDGVIASGGIPPIEPGETTSMDFMLDGSNPSHRYFSYATMVIPSNDAFVANGDPMAHMIFDAGGDFVGGSFVIMGADVLDAGTEVNDEVPANTAFFGQGTPDTGVDENGVVHSHPGFLSPGSGGILDDPMFANADFTASAYQVARVTITPEPTTLTLLGLGAAALLRRNRRHLAAA